MSKTVAESLIFNWRRPFASAYFRSAGSYLGIRVVIITLAGLASQCLLTNYLAKEDYGLLIWAAMILALLSPFGLPGISTSITGAVARGFDGNFSRGTWLEMVGGTVGGLVLFGIASYYWFWTQEETKALIFVVAGVLGPGLWLDTHQSYWNGKKNFKALFWWAVPVRLLQLVATTIVLLYSSNPVWVFSVQTVILVVANIVAAMGIMTVGSLNKEYSKEYQSYGWFYTGLSCIGNVTSQLDKIIIGVFFGLESLAVFAVGELIYKYFYNLPQSLLSQIFMPRLAEMEAKQAARWLKNRKLYLIGGTVLVVAVIGIATPTVYPLLFSAKYADSIFYVYLFLGCIVLGSPMFLSDTLLKAQAMKRETMIGWSIFCFTSTVFIPLFGFFFGVAGVVIARGVRNGATSAYYLWQLECLANK